MIHAICLVIFLSDQSLFLTHQKRNLTRKFFQFYDINFQKTKSVKFFFYPEGLRDLPGGVLVMIFSGKDKNGIINHLINQTVFMVYPT